MDVIKNSFAYEAFSIHVSARPIRLLKLLPTENFTDNIECCQLFQTYLDDRPDFEALSYTWGDVRDTVAISLHGLGHRVTRNLESALCKKIEKHWNTNQEEHLFVGHDSEWNACEELFVHRPWWSRAWIIQEVIHPGEVVVLIGRMDLISIEDICASYQQYAWLKTTRKLYLTKLAEIERIEEVT
jgi:hypothetical protein